MTWQIPPFNEILFTRSANLKTMFSNYQGVEMSNAAGRAPGSLLFIVF
jgi:hypothetical protein